MADEPKCSSRLEYASVSCNRTPLCADWGRNGLVAYGSCHSVVLYRPDRGNASGSIEHILNGHTDRINCVAWINNGNAPEDEIISGSTDKTAILWGKHKGKWSSCDILKGHTNTVNSVAAIKVPYSMQSLSQRTLVVTASADSLTKIWQRNEQGQFNCCQTISFGYGFALTVSLAILPHTDVPVLACGCEDSKIHIFTEKTGQFVKVQSLAGHEDWIRCTDFAQEDSGDLLLASSSQDCFIRIWRFSLSPTTGNPHKVSHDVDEILDELRLTSNLFQVEQNGCPREFFVVLDAVLSGHEDIVYGVHWHKSQPKGDNFTQPLCLLSSSLDKTLIIWNPDPETGVWLETVRVGGVGGTMLGFYGGVFSPDGQAILGHSYQGAFHLWKSDNKESSEQDSRSWQPGVTVGGHFAPVQDISWEPSEGLFLLSVSSDQTTRLHAPWKHPGKETSWHEIARPQVHGYDMQCLTMLNRYTFASGAEEKVVRIFKAPRQFLVTLQSLCDIQEGNKNKEALPLGASVPALGLSNKAVFEGDLDSLKKDLNDPAHPMKASAFASEEPASFTPAALSRPPTEDVLLQNTLWPEVQKLYGHGYEIFCISSSPDGTILASSCKASKAEHACVILWDTQTWRQVCSLSGHSLTVTQIAFSHSGQRILTVSRDRTWAMFRRKDENTEGPLYSLVSHSSTLPKSQQHSRIIWSCSWSHDDRYVATASRDKKVIMWGRAESDKGAWVPVSSPLDVGEPATAVDLAPCLSSHNSYVAAVGTESGRIALYSWSAELQNEPAGTHWTILANLSTDLCHVLTVKRLRWRPLSGNNDGILHLASCGKDHTVKIYQISGIVK